MPVRSGYGSGRGCFLGMCVYVCGVLIISLSPADPSTVANHCDREGRRAKINVAPHEPDRMLSTLDSSPANAHTVGTVAPGCVVGACQQAGSKGGLIALKICLQVHLSNR